MEHPNSDLASWIAGLRRPGATAPAPDDLDAIDREALDSAVGFAAEHTRRYIASSGADDGWAGPRPILILYTRGRRSGQMRRNPVLYFDHEGGRYVIASMGGAPEHPQWYRNLVAEPRVYVRLGTELQPATAVTVDADERARVWPALVARYPMFVEYQAKTERAIPLVRLDPA